ncbi:hypothetical protein pdam_00024515 [Pocillopora damicornis]|uniref:Uncharacterized protein n=1 Tax=Pocillopora damicornis TaxID=46731 RepID=A0A3M6T5T0_POCDA|nr:hypothetical protein pdam_00024515 [Pocillopora damicornis]
MPEEKKHSCNFMINDAVFSGLPYSSTPYHQVLISEYTSAKNHNFLLVYLQIRKHFKRKMNIIFPSSIKNNSTRKSSQVNLSEVGDVWEVELQSCAEFESKLHLT